MLRLLALLVPLAAADEWTALPLPSFCQAPRPALQPEPLRDARHLALARAQPRQTEPPLARLPVSVVRQMLEEDARAGGRTLELARHTPLLLARGDAAALDAARALIADLDRAAAAFEVELEVVLANGDPAPSDGARAPAAEKRRVRGAELVCFGTRSTRGFLSSFEVEVAADSGAAEPVVGSAHGGATLHVRALRLDGGRRVHLSGVLDVADPPVLASFDPSTSDLGVLQEPRLRAAQAWFAGAVDSGGTLEVVLQGTGLAKPDWSAKIRAVAKPDPEPREGGWQAVDLAFLSHEPEPLPAPHPGEGLAFSEPPDAGEAAPAISASVIQGTLEAGRAAASARGARATIYRAEDLLLVPRADAELLREARALVRGSEALRGATGTLEVRRGPLRALLPAASGFPARLVVGEESTRLADYRLELAPQTWMPVPEVAFVFDGLALEAELAPGAASCSFWIAESGEPSELGRDEAQLGRLQLLARGLRGGSARIAAGEPERAVLDPAAGLTLRLAAP